MSSALFPWTASPSAAARRLGGPGLAATSPQTTPLLVLPTPRLAAAMPRPLAKLLQAITLRLATASLPVTMPRVAMMAPVSTSTTPKQQQIAGFLKESCPHRSEISRCLPRISIISAKTHLGFYAECFCGFTRRIDLPAGIMLEPRSLLFAVTPRQAKCSVCPPNVPFSVCGTRALF